MMRRHALDLAVLGCVLLLGVARLAEPFTGDQALNMLMGKVIAVGGVPYVDLWDLKHPGVFFFFAAGGALFGFDEVGIHLFELSWMLSLAVIVRLVAGQYLRSRVAAALSPALAVGAYYAGATSIHMTQTEVLLGLPLLVSLATVVAALRPASRRPRLWLFTSGLTAGIVFVFKAPYVILPGLFWLLAFVEWRRERRVLTLPGILNAVSPLLAGLLLPILATFLYLSRGASLDLLWSTFVDHPRETASQSGVDPRRLLDGSTWFVRTYGPLLLLALIGAWARLRRGWELLTAGLVVWTAAGAALIWMQVISWWGYHYLLLLVPIGLLAAQGIEKLWSMAAVVVPARRRRLAAATALAGFSLLAVLQIAPATTALADTVQTRPLPLDNASLRPYQAERNHDYAVAVTTTAFLDDPQSHAGPIYIFGNPLLYHIAGRPPAIPLLAPWFHPTRALWDRLVDDLMDARPAYILVSDQALETMAGYNPSIRQEVEALPLTLEQRYERLRTDVGGTWYIRGDLAQPRAGS
jgi:hypothetical protein